jgi:OPT oligopeptide transporter protein
MVAHCILFWGKDVIASYRSAKERTSDDRHHVHMAKHYKETPAWWYGAVLLISFILGLIVVLKEDITLPAWAYVISLALGIVFGPFVSIPQYNNYLRSIFLTLRFAEYPSVCSLWKRHCHKQYIEDGSRPVDPWTSHW